jgi:competence protein ComEC
MHMFAIDGLRIALLSAMIVTLLRAARLTRAWCGFIAIPLIWFYTAATGWESSAIRASIMMTVVLGGWAMRRPGDLLNSLAVAGFIILLWDPNQLFEASFQLSFAVMLVIALLLPPLNDCFDRWLRFDPLIPDDLIPQWKKFLLNAARITLRYLGLSFASWIGSIPLSAYYFHLFSPVSTLANLFAVPLGTWALIANLGALLCGDWFPWATSIFNHSAWGAMNLMTDVSARFTEIPGSYFYVHSPSKFSVILYYVVFVAAFSGWFKNARRKIAGLAALLLIALSYIGHWEMSRGETTLTVLPLDGGHAIYVDADGRANDWLINTGSHDAAVTTTRDYLRAQGVNRLPHLVLAEASVRNCGGAPMLSTNFPIDELATASGRYHSVEYSVIVKGLEKQVTRHQIWNAGSSNGCWQVLYPENSTTISRADDRPLVMMGNFGGTRILLLSELSRTSQSALLFHTNDDLHADLVIAGLPEKDEPLCTPLINAIQPKAIIIADSDFPPNRRATDALKNRLAATKIPTTYTRDSGAVKIIIQNGAWQLVKARP